MHELELTLAALPPEIDEPAIICPHCGCEDCRETFDDYYAECPECSAMFCTYEPVLELEL